MGKQILLAIGNDADTSDSLRFVTSFLGPRPDLVLTLFFAVPRTGSASAAQLAMEGMTLTQHGIDRAYDRRAGELLNRSRNWLLEQGFAPENVEAKSVISHADVAREIVQEARNGLYDAVVMGSRRASVWTEALMADSVSRRMLWQNLDFPIWICRRPLPDAGRHILLCTDGSEQSLRMADHVGFMLAPSHAGEKTDHWVTVLHVAAPGEDSEQNALFVQEKTTIQLLENGFPLERLQAKTLSARRLTGAVVREIETGHYAVIAMGRKTGIPDTLEKFFPASLSAVLLRNLDNFSLWVSR